MLDKLSTTRKRSYTLSVVVLAALLSLAALPLAKGLHTHATTVPPSQKPELCRYLGL